MTPGGGIHSVDVSPGPMAGGYRSVKDGEAEMLGFWYDTGSEIPEVVDGLEDIDGFMPSSTATARYGDTKRGVVLDEVSDFPFLDDAEVVRIAAYDEGGTVVRIQNMEPLNRVTFESRVLDPVMIGESYNEEPNDVPRQDFDRMTRQIISRLENSEFEWERGT